jgi:ribosomal subunit interface protein
MKLPLQITTRNISLSEAAENTIRDKTAKLETFHDNITACRVLVEVPHRHKHQGMAYNVRIDITVPGNEIVVKREPNEDLYVAIRDSFDAARRQLQEFSARRRGDVKTHDNGNGRYGQAAASLAEEAGEQTGTGT